MCDSAIDHEELHAIAEIIEACKPGVGLDPYKAFTKYIHRISSPVDLKEHNEKFEEALNSVGIYLVWGMKASHALKHAYVLRFGDGEGEIYTILTNEDLDLRDDSAFSWKAADLFNVKFRVGETEITG